MFDSSTFDDMERCGSSLSSFRSHGRRGPATPGHADHAESGRPLRHGGAPAAGILERGLIDGPWGVGEMRAFLEGEHGKKRRENHDC